MDFHDPFYFGFAVGIIDGLGIAFVAWCFRYQISARIRQARADELERRAVRRFNRSLAVTARRSAHK